MGRRGFVRDGLVEAAGPLVLAVALLAAFARLVAEPTGLIVDGERPALDHRRRFEPRGVGNDLTGLFLPRFLWMSEQVRRSGRVPHWDPRGFLGRPNVGNPQAGLFYPPIRIAWHRGRPETLGWFTVAHLYWAGVGAFALGRSIGSSRLSATVAGATFMLNPYVLAQVAEGHLPHVWAASWYPWAFLGGVLFRRRVPVGWFVLPASLAMSLLCGHPQEGVYLAAAIGAWAAFDAIAVGSSGGREECLRTAARWAIALGLVAGLSAPEWVPDLRVSPYLAREARAGGGGAGPYHLYPSNLLQLIAPRALGGPSDYLGRVNSWETMCAVGTGPLLLVLGAGGHRDRRTRRGWFALLALATIHAAGKGAGLAPALAAVVPGLGFARVPARSLFLSAVAASMLAGLGMEAWGRGGARRPRRLVRGGLAAIGVAIAAGWALEWVLPGTAVACASARLRHDPTFIVATVGYAIACFVRSARGSRPAGARFLFGAVVLAELIAGALAIMPVSPSSRFLGATPLGEPAVGRLREAGDVGRVRARDAFYPDLMAFVDGVEKTNLDDLFQIEHAARLYRPLYAIFGPEARWRSHRPSPEVLDAMLDRLGVRVLISDRPDPLLSLPAVASGSIGGARRVTYDNADAMPRAYIVPAARVVGPDDATVESLAALDPREAVVMANDPLGGDGAAPRQRFRPARYVPDGPDRVSIEAETTGPGLLVIADAWMPGWSARVDGRAEAVHRGDLGLRVVPIREAGAHRVSLRYRAPGLATGGAIAVASATATLAIGVLGISGGVGIRIGILDTRFVVREKKNNYN